jgi:Cu/Ag efflux protein CusF
MSAAASKDTGLHYALVGTASGTVRRIGVTFGILPRGVAVAAVALGLGSCLSCAFASDDLAARLTPFATAQVHQNLHQGFGVVTDINDETGSLTVNHEDIPGLMPKMEMLFRVDPPSLSKGVRPGDRIQFLVEAKTFKIRELKVVEQAK